MSGDLIVRVIFGNQYSDAVIVFQILIISFFFTLIGSVFSFTFIGIHKEKYFTKSLFMGAGFFLLSIISLTNFFGIKGAAFSYALFEIIVFTIMAFELNKIFKINFVNSICIPGLHSYCYNGFNHGNCSDQYIIANNNFNFCWITINSYGCQNKN